MSSRPAEPTTARVLLLFVVFGSLIVPFGALFAAPVPFVLMAAIGWVPLSWKGFSSVWFAFVCFGGFWMVWGVIAGLVEMWKGTRAVEPPAVEASYGGHQVTSAPEGSLTALLTEYMNRPLPEPTTATTPQTTGSS